MLSGEPWLSTCDVTSIIALREYGEGSVDGSPTLRERAILVHPPAPPAPSPAGRGASAADSPPSILVAPPSSGGFRGSRPAGEHCAHGGEAGKDHGPGRRLWDQHDRRVAVTFKIVEP